MARVAVRNGNVEQALKRFKQKSIKDGTLQDVRKKAFYEKPGVQKRNAKKEAIKNSQKKNRRSRRD